MSPLYFFLGLPDDVFWLSLSGLIFLAMTILFLLGPFWKNRSELMQGSLGFLGGMTLFHLFLAGGMYWENHDLNTLAALGAITGSAFLLKFPLLALQSGVMRKNLFYGVLAIGWLAVLWLFLFPHKPETPMIIGSLYMIIVSGALSGFYIIWKGFQFKDPALKIKCIGGGCSIVLCCFLTHIIVLTIGMTVLAKTFMLLSPVALVFSFYFVHALERRRMLEASLQR